MYSLSVTTWWSARNERSGVMRICVVNQFFHPDVAATAQILTDLAVDLSARGARVTAVTSRAAYNGGPRYEAREEYQGVDIRRVPSTNFGRGSIPRRMSDYLSFYSACAAQLAVLPRQDVVVTLSTPPLIALLGSLHRVARGSRFLYWVQDLYPDVAVAMGVLRDRSATTRAFAMASKAALRSADAVVALGEEMAQRLIDRGARSERVSVIHNWSDGSVIGTVPKEKNWFLDRHGLRGKFVVQYSGNMGRGHELTTLLNAARRLRHRSDVSFVFIGDGHRRSEVEVAMRDGLENVRLLPYQPRTDLPYSLGAADLSAITLSEGLEGMIVPSKLYSALAARTPVAFVGPKTSEVARILATEGCGRAFSHGDDEGVSRFIEELAANSYRARQMGEAGRSAFEAKYDRHVGTTRFWKICERLAAA
jgi:colanic acid biosynthesis glycosyl transferase WcaI